MSTALWLTNLLMYSIQVTALVAAGGLFARLLPLSAPRTRLAYWQALLLLCLVWPAAQPWRTTATPADGAVSVALGPLNVVTRPATARNDVTPWIAGLLGAGCAVRLGWLALGLVRLSGYRRRARPAGETPAALVTVRQALRTRAEIRLSDEIDGPSTFGLLRPTVLLPAACVHLPVEQTRAIVCHELLHVRRGDWGFTVAEECVRAVFWFHPAVHWLVGRVRLARELAVDRAVVETCGTHRPYLEALIESARLARRLRTAPALLGLGHSNLKKRIELLLEEASMPSLSKIRLSLRTLASASAVLVAGVLAAWSFPLTAASSDKPSAPAKVEQPATDREPKIVSKRAPVYPPAAKAAGIQGAVVLELTLDKTGRVSDTRVVQSVPELEQAALDAVRQWRYEPVSGPSGAPVEARLTVTVRFQLADKPQQNDFATPPKVLESVQPVYPPEAFRARLEGTVLLEITIDTAGAVSNVRIVEGVPAFDQAAVAAIRQWRFQPALNAAGQPVTATARTPVVFKLF